LHTSKGLEFPIVLIVDVHDGVLPRPVPHLPAEERLQEREKDVRLLYVGMSRAMKDLTLFAHEGLASEFLLGLDGDLWDLPE
jgi:superfamily I DNA/RNA helicase